MESEVRVTNNSREVIEKIRKLSDSKLKELAQTVVEIAREEAPYRTGNLKASINQDAPAPLSRRIFTQTGYGGYVHEGTSRIAPNPFLVRSLDRALPEFIGSGPWL